MNKMTKLCIVTTYYKKTYSYMMSRSLTNSQRILFIFIAMFIVSVLLLETIFFSRSTLDELHNEAPSMMVLSPGQHIMHTHDQEGIIQDKPGYIINNNNHINRRLNDHSDSNEDENTKLHKFYDPLYDKNKDWFNKSEWHSNIVVNFSCPVYENICIYNQHFYVHDKIDEFDLKWKQQSDLLGAAMPNLRPSSVVYKKFFHATIWNKNEYETTKCYYNNIYNHLILEASYQTMLGEFYSRTLRFLHYLNNMKHLISDDIQLWLLIGDQKSLYVSHYLFTERFSIYNLQHFTSMFDHIPCQCYHRILFCGFQKEGHEIPWPRKDRKGKKKKGNDILEHDDDEQQQKEKEKEKERENDVKGGNHTNLMPLKTLLSRMEPEEARDIYPEMIVEYNRWIDVNDINLNDDVRKWKYDQLIDYFVNNKKNAQNDKFKQEIDPLTLMSEIDEWKFIGLYDRKVRRSWLKIEKHQKNCNEKYNKYKMFCHIIILEDFLHSRDVIIIHRASFMLIGVHGAQLTDAIWMKYDELNIENKYIIELLPYGGPKYTSSIEKPTALGVIFWNSKYNHVGLKLANDSMQFPNKRWDDNDFFVKWERLTMVIDYLIIDDGGYCKKYKKANELIVPKEIQQLGFAIYNAYCIQNIGSQAWHGVKAPRLY